jgi:hypothetical protein
MLLPIVLATVGPGDAGTGTLGNASFSRPLSTSMFESVPSEYTTGKAWVPEQPAVIARIRTQQP